MSESTHNIAEYSVTELSIALKKVVEAKFGYVRVKGEISGLKIATSGHVYFTLKDEKSVLSAVCWRGVAQRLKFTPEDGLEVVVAGKITTYAGRSNYQIVVEYMEPAGIGALMALLEQRKQKLAAEGLFAEERKHKLPYLPRLIAVVTSPTGAVIRDILHRITDRFPSHVLVWPVMVQGELAAQQIADAINELNKVTGKLRPDLIIVARGGGGVEDLWPFNEEIVVRAVADSEIAIISAIGHETDTTLIDFAADLRAPTPTAAAEMAVPLLTDLLYKLRECQQRMDLAVGNKLQRQQQHLQALARGLPRPLDLLLAASQRLDNWSERLFGAVHKLLLRRQTQLDALISALRPIALLRALKQQQLLLGKEANNLQQAIWKIIAHKEQYLISLGKQLDLLDSKQILKRGFALVYDCEGGLVTSAHAAYGKNKLSLSFYDGDVRVNISRAKTCRSQGGKAKRLTTDNRQENLFE